MSDPVPSARNCDGCTMCCKILAVEDLGKPAHQLCVNCDAGKGCTIYADRPGGCRTFSCGYLLEPSFGPEWKPSVCGFLLQSDLAGTQILVSVDADTPDAWKRTPYYAAFKQWARNGERSGAKVIVIVPDGRWIRIFPDRDVVVL